MNWKVFLGFFVLPIIRVFRIDCLKAADIVNGLNAGAKYPSYYNSKGRKVKSLSAFWNLGFLKINALKKRYWPRGKNLLFSDTRNTR